MNDKPHWTMRLIWKVALYGLAIWKLWELVK